jgi:hypothetical protein
MQIRMSHLQNCIPSEKQFQDHVGKAKAASFRPAAFLKLTIERRLLLGLFFLRIALLANLLVLGRFHAAFVRAFLTRLLGVIAAARANTHRAGEKAKGSDQG